MAPANASAPPAAHTARNGQGLGTLAAIPGEKNKIPPPGPVVIDVVPPEVQLVGDLLAVEDLRELPGGVRRLVGALAGHFTIQPQPRASGFNGC